VRKRTLEEMSHANISTPPSFDFSSEKEVPLAGRVERGILSWR